MRDATPSVVSLAGAESAADQGLASLGLLMQLGAALGATLAIVAGAWLTSGQGLARGDGRVAWIVLIAALSIARANMHRSAGAQLAGPRGADARAFAAARRYIGVGLAHALLVGVVLIAFVGVASSTALGVAIALGAWPIALHGMLDGPRLRRFAKDGAPVGEDRGFEGASILMAIFGCAGFAVVAALFTLLLGPRGWSVNEITGLLLMLGFSMLLLRSGLHAHAGFEGLRALSVERTVDLTSRYASFGMGAAFVAVGALSLVMIRARASVAGVALIGATGWALAAWPVIVRRFLGQRQFGDLLAGDRAPAYQRAPDRGLATLGWLLLAHAVLVLGAIAILYGASTGTLSHRDPISPVFRALGTLAPFGARPLGWIAAATGLEVVAAVALVHMTTHHRFVATVYAVAALAVVAASFWPAVAALHGARAPFASPKTLAFLVPLILHAIVPLATLLLVNRRHAPVARARFRVSP